MQPQKILFFINENKPYYSLLKDAAQKLGVEMTIAFYTDVIHEYKDNQTNILINHEPLESFSLVFFRTIQGFHEQMFLITERCRQLNIPVYDKALRFNLPWTYSKAFQYLRLNQLGIPTIKSVYISETHQKHNPFTFPLIAKTTTQSQGEGVFLCSNSEELQQLFENHQFLLLQPFIPNDSDVRILVVGDQVIASMKRQRLTSDEYRNNVSLGGSALAYTPSKTEVDLALQSAKALDYSLAGVDLIFDSAEQMWKIIEVNRSPQLGGIMSVSQNDIPLEIMKYFVSQLEK